MAEKSTVMAVQKAVEDANAKKRNFVETVELAINLKDIDLSVPKNRITDDIILPYGRGKDVHVCVIGGGELADIIVGSIIGVVGIAGASINYPVYKKILAKSKEKYAADIIRLASEIANEK